MTAPYFRPGTEKTIIIRSGKALPHIGKPRKGASYSESRQQTRAQPVGNRGTGNGLKCSRITPKPRESAIVKESSLQFVWCVDLTRPDKQPLEETWPGRAYMLR